jgi:hypothetical protein
LASVFAPDRTVSEPPAVMSTPSGTDAVDELMAIVTAMAAATDTGPLELSSLVSELGVSVAPSDGAPAFSLLWVSA